MMRAIHPDAVRFAVLVIAIGLAGACSDPPVRESRREDLTLSLVREIGADVFKYPGAPMLGFNAMALGGGRLYIHDSQGDVPFYVVDPVSFELKGFGAWGSGPGEIRPGFPVVLSFAGSRLYAHALFDAKLLVFDEAGSLAAEHAVGPAVRGMGSVHVVADTLALVLPMQPTDATGEFARLHRIDADRGLLVEGRPFGDDGELPGFEPLHANPMLKQGPVHVDPAGRIHWANYYSSLLATFESDGRSRRIGLEPWGVVPPAAEISMSGSVVAGDPERATQGAIALASDDRYLYRLYSGFELTRQEVMAYRAKQSQKELPLGEAQTVDVFDHSDGSYKFSFDLPVAATNIAVDDRFLYVLTIEGLPRLLVFEKPGPLTN